MRHRERGVTFLGWIVLLIPVALVLYAGIRLTPVYLEYMKIARTLEQVSEENQGETVDPRALRGAIEAHVRTVVGRYRGRIVAWDVVNEAVAEDGSGLRDTVFRQKLGESYLELALRTCVAWPSSASW